MPRIMSTAVAAVLDEVVRVRLQPQLDAFSLEDRQQLLHRPPELGLAAPTPPPAGR